MKKYQSILVGFFLFVFISSCSKSEDPTVINETNVITETVSSITSTTAVSGGVITVDGGANVSEKGVVWGANPNPTITLSTKTNDGTNTGPFSSLIIGLLNNSTYYLRAYATYNKGTVYGNELIFTTKNVFGVPITDIDGNSYQTVIICNQTWSRTNLNVSRYRNGDVIPQVSDPSVWANLTTGAWCYYNNDPSNGAIYGKLYNWYAVTDPRGLAPTGWHIPTINEYAALSNCLGDINVSGGKMKEIGTIHWRSPNKAAINSSSFTGLPGGSRSVSNGSFSNIGEYGYFWSSSHRNYFYVWSLNLSYYNGGALISDVHNKSWGQSVRLVKD